MAVSIGCTGSMLATGFDLMRRKGGFLGVDKPAVACEVSLPTACGSRARRLRSAEN